MKRLLTTILISLLLINCKSQKQSVTYISQSLKISPISKNVYTHITYLNTDDYGKVECNGMIYINNNKAIVFDTPTSSTVSDELIKWITEVKKCTIRAVVINHFHEDCLGGLEAFHDSNIPSYSSNKTIALSKANNFVVPQIGFDTELELKLGNKKVINAYFGEAHTKDNIVSYLPSEGVLFGGCPVKSLNASKGYTGDANITEWSTTIRRVKNAFPEIKTIIPGHGKSGDVTLLDYTIQLFE
jgi:metallo-beta-lactamase class B